MLDAATVLFVDRGLHRTTMDMVSSRAGLSREAVQQLYPIKRLLIADVTESLCRKAVDRIRRHQSRGLDHLITTLSTWAYIGTTRPGWVRLCNEFASIDQPYAFDTNERRERLRGALSQSLTNATNCASSRADAIADFLLTVGIGLAAQKADGADLQLAAIRRQVGFVVRGVHDA
ncbi:TetR/AcrR family transcriptional regulator [Nocardia abscessus]|uniref:TetR/AcrR family transcriptional regulator n=1 Tax=Nocardia abscessus TaxID=120957 RepID=A0ABS0CEK4_9NOCA|nr:TetR/AcrR family transcriptional regulator [Nocardia abscessus]MBF6228777.1 TetR/AcrR family transcriptional regulator [Nocardia abscessus]